MVATTVAIAATVYVYVSGMLGGDPEASPTVGMTQVQNYISIQEIQRGPITNSTALTVTIVNISGVSYTATALPTVMEEETDGDSYLASGDVIIFNSGWLGGSHVGHVPHTVNLIYQGDAVGTAKFTPI